MLYSLLPHMHLRGKAFRFEAVYPDGSDETLLDVPRYDFNWQIATCWPSRSAARRDAYRLHGRTSTTRQTIR